MSSLNEDELSTEIPPAEADVVVCEYPYWSIIDDVVKTIAENTKNIIIFGLALDFMAGVNANSQL